MGLSLGHFVRASLLALAFLSSNLLKAETGLSDREILLGQSVAVSGTLAALGKQYTAGAQLYFDAVNEAGGVHGRRLRMISLDDGYDTQRALDNTKKLLREEKVFALFNYLGTGITTAHLPVIVAEKVPFFAPYTGADHLRKAHNRYLFHIRASYGDEAEKIVEHLHSLGYARIGVVHQNDVFGRSALASVEEAMAKRKIRPAAIGVIESNSTDAKAAAAALTPYDPQVIILATAGGGAIAFIREYAKKELRTQYYAFSVVSSEQLIRELGPDSHGITVTQVMPFPWKSLSGITREYQRLLKARDPEAKPGYTHFEGYVAAKALVEGLRQAGRELTREKLVATLERMDALDLGGFVVSFRPGNHNGSRFVELTLIGKDGRFVQ
jgi:ABC-type branched-subunit amino acid transport system substrate-binding protein